MIDRLPPDILALVAESSDDTDVGICTCLACSHGMVAILRFVKPRIKMHAVCPEQAIAMSSSGMWQVQALKLVEPEDSRRISLGASNFDNCCCPAQSTPVRRVREDAAAVSTESLLLLAGLASLVELTVDGCGLTEEGLAAIAAAVPQLTILRLRRQQRLTSLAPLAHAHEAHEAPDARCRRSGLREFELSSCWRVADLCALSDACPLLEVLSLHQYRGGDLPTAARLRRVSVTDSQALASLWALSACGRLEELSLVVCHGLRDLSPLADCAVLSELTLDRCTGIRGLAPLSACTNLRRLTLSRCPRLSGLDALAMSASLRQVSVIDCPGLTQPGSASRVARALLRIRTVIGNPMYARG